jgi:hypothetical protein
MAAIHDAKPWLWKPGQSGNPTGNPRKPRRSFDAVRRFEALGIDPLSEAVALAQDPALPKVARLKAWLELCEFAYPKLSPIASHENMSARLEELQRSWDTETWKRRRWSLGRGTSAARRCMNSSGDITIGVVPSR